MSVPLYTLITGKIKRKTIGEDGSVIKVRNISPFTFAPSPSEFSANKHRLRPAGLADDDSDDARDMKLNTNQTDAPVGRRAKQSGATASQPIAIPEDICTVLDIPAARAMIGNLQDLALLEKFLEQELSNQPRVRKLIIKAIEERKTVLRNGAVGPLA